MELDRNTLNAFVDGELTADERARVARLLTQCPSSDRYVREQTHLRETLKLVGHPNGPLPDALVKAVRTAPISLLWRLRDFMPSHRFTRVVAPAGTALVLGLMLGLLVHPAADYGTDAAGRLVAQGRLENVLDSALAESGRGTGNLRVGISFRNKSALDCRTFSRGPDAGLACHKGGAWVIEVLALRPSDGPVTDYRMAGSEMPDAVRRAVAASIVGAPFDAAAERSARDRRWTSH